MGDGVTTDNRGDAEGPARVPDFRTCLGMPPARYRSLNLDPSPGIDGQLAKTLLDYKSGRQQQALKRFSLAKRDQGFDPGIKLAYQLDRMNEENAPLLIFEMLFLLTGNEVPADDIMARYLDAIGCFHPDDAICHGAVYNALILIALRRSEPALAERLCILADEAYQRCGSRYLQGFVHLHLVFLRLCMADPAAAGAAARRAGVLFGAAPEAASERAMVEIAALWVEAEAIGVLPPLSRLATLRETMAAGEFWPETFVVCASLLLHVSAAEDPAHALAAHSELEAILRLRGMTQVLPVMQLLREDYRRRSAGTTSAQADPPGLAEELVLLLLPDADTVLTNWGQAAAGQGLIYERLAVARALMRARTALRENRFDQAAPLVVQAARLIQDRGLGWLARQSRPIFELFCQQAQSRRLFVEQAREIRDTILARPDLPGLADHRPQELTRTEFGIVQRLDRLASNKLLARELGVSEAAVKFHLKNIYRKLGVHDRRAALQGATARGWVAQGARSAGQVPQPAARRPVAP